MKGSKAGIILEGPGNVTLEQALKLNFKASNNQAENDALIASLKLARDIGSRSYDATLTRSLSRGKLPKDTKPRN